MAYGDVHPYKTDLSNHKANIVFTVRSFSCIQKVPSAIVFIALCCSYLLCTVGFSCNPKNSEAAPNAPLSEQHVTRGQCIGTITTLGQSQPDCHIKKSRHYGFIPLEDPISVVEITHAASMPEAKATPPTPIQAAQPPLGCSITEPLIDPLPLQQDPSSDALPKVHDTPVADQSIRANATYIGSRQPSLLEEIQETGDELCCGKRGNNSEKIKDTENKLHCDKRDSNKAPLDTLTNVTMGITEEEALKNLSIFKKMHTDAIKIIKQITKDAMLLNDAVEDNLKLGLGKTIPLAFKLALQAVSHLQSALQLEKSYQLGIAYRRPTNLNAEYKTVIKNIENLKKALCEEYAKVLSAEVLLDQCIAFLNKMCDLLYDIRHLHIDSPDPTNGIRHLTKQLSFGDDLQWKKAQKKLEKLEDEQLSMIRSFRKIESDQNKTLVAIQALVYLIRNTLENAIWNLDALNLKLKFVCNSNILTGKVKNIKRIQEIITDVDLDQEEIQAIQDSLNSATFKMLIT